MDKRQAVILAMIILAFGLFVHGLKVIRKAHFSNSDRSGIALGDVDDTPYHISSDEMEQDRIKSRGRGRGMHLAGAVAKFNQYDFSGGKVVAENAKAKEELKKKKKKTTKDKPEVKTATNTDVTPYYDTNTNPANTSNNINNNAVGTVGEPPKTTISPTGAGDTNKPANTYQEWAALLLGTPSPTSLNRFVQAYKSGQVNSEVFYQILEAMFSEQNPQQQQLAVTAAGDAPSAQSFEFLVQVTKTQSSAAAQQAGNIISGYSALNEVGALRIVMNAYIGDSTTIQDATTVLLNSTETYIANRAPTATTGATGAPANLAAVYAGFAPVLNHIITLYANNPAIINAAQTALGLISSVVVTP